MPLTANTPKTVRGQALVNDPAVALDRRTAQMDKAAHSRGPCGQGDDGGQQGIGTSQGR